MNGAWDITVKDLRLLILDKRALVLLLLLPLLFIAILGMSTGQFLTTGDRPKAYRVAIIDESQTELSKEVIEKLQVHKDLQTDLFKTPKEAATVDEREPFSAILTIGPQFVDRVDELTMYDMLGGAGGGIAESRDVADLELKVRPAMAEGELIRYFLFGEIYRTIFPEVASRNALFRPYLPDDTEPVDGGMVEGGAGPGEAGAGETGAGETGAGETGDIGTSAAATAAVPAATAGRPQNLVYRFLVPGFTVMFVFFLINIMARSFIAERDLGTLRRLQLSPISPVAVLVGKTAPFYIASVIQTSLLFLCGRLLFDMSWGPEPIYLIPVILCTSAAATSLGLMLAAWVRTDQQVSAFGTSLVLVLGGVSGCFIPRAWLPDMMKTLSLATPHAWALRAFDAVLTKDAVDSIFVIDNCFVLLGFALAFFVAGWWRFRQIPA